jgi:hypothetical protein
VGVCRTKYAANLMVVTRKSSGPWVKALLHSVYDQPDPDAGLCCVLVGDNHRGAASAHPVQVVTQIRDGPVTPRGRCPFR